MKYSAAAIVPMFTSLAAASPVARDTTSFPFTLAIVAEGKPENGRRFAACHEGAGIESLCLPPGDDHSYAVFQANQTSSASSPLAGYDPAFQLAYQLPTTTGPLDSTLIFFNDRSTNVVLPLLEPGTNGQSLTFDDKKGYLAIFAYNDDTKTPPTTNTTPIALKNWWLCTTSYIGHVFQTLAWVDGQNQQPQNPSCFKIDVRRDNIPITPAN